MRLTLTSTAGLPRVPFGCVPVPVADAPNARSVQDYSHPVRCCGIRVDSAQHFSRNRQNVSAVRSSAHCTKDSPPAMWAADPVTASIDDLKIERVVANLLQNALKYTPGGSSIVVQLGATSHVVRVSVDDVGPGMTPTEIGFIFDKFRRASTAGGHDGWGLGLYVSKRIVLAHGGRIG